MAEGANEIITQLITGVLTGGAGAATSLLGVFRKTKERLKALEELVGEDGTDGPLKTGLFLSIYALEETTKKLKREIESWEDDPPKWAERLMSRARSNSSSDLTTQVQFEEQVQRSLRSYNERLTRHEDGTEQKIRRIEDDLERRMTAEPDGKLLTREEYLEDSRMRAEEMAKIREQLATVNGLLRGIMAAIGIIDPENPSDPPRHPPRLPPRTGR